MKQIKARLNDFQVKKCETRDLITDFRSFHNGSMHKYVSKDDVTALFF